VVASPRLERPGSRARGPPSILPHVERRQLEYFLAVVDHGSFTAAAQALFVAQPSLSQAVRSLERELRADLFFRVPRGVLLTPAGEALLLPARQAIRDLATARAAVQQVVGLTGGRLDITMLPALALDPMAPIVAAFRHRYPDVRIAVRQPEETRRVYDDVRTGTTEMGFLDQREVLVDELETEEICRQDMLAVLPPGTERDDSPVSWEEMLDRGLIVGTPGTVVRNTVEAWAREHGRRVLPAVELGRRESGVYLVVAGAGVAAFPAPLAALARSLGAVVRPLAMNEPRVISMCWRTGPLSPAADAFRSLVREHVRTQT
jgi:DNA-binding transcriptional LysR family regulator